MTKNSKRYWVIGLVLLSGISISSVYATGLQGCDDYKVDSGAGAICHRVDIIISQVNTMISNQDVIKAQNSQLIEEQHISNNISADQYCTTTGDIGFFKQHGMSYMQEYGANGTTEEKIHNDCMNTYLERMK